LYATIHAPVKRVLLVLIMLGISALLIVPVWYFSASSSIPRLESEFDLERLLRERIEGERAQMIGATSQRPDPARITFRTPELIHYPKEAVSLYISSLGCPYYFQTPREKDLAWLWRLFRVQMLGSQDVGGANQCELELARHIAWAVQIRGGLAETLAIHRIRQALPKGKLVAYDLATWSFDQGVVGLEAAAEALYQRKLETLKLDELAELSLALPPLEYFYNLQLCSNASGIRQARDSTLAQLANDSLVPVDRAKQAQAQPLACTRM
jgi:hypothetical protein